MLSEKDMVKCRGCAAKLAYTPLNASLKKLDAIGTSVEDSIDLGVLISGKKFRENK